MAVDPLHNARVQYQQSGRGGTLTFQSDALVLHLDWEFAGGDALALIFVPTEAGWESSTQLPLEHRRPVLEFVAQHVLRNQGGRSFEMQDNTLVIY